MSDHLKVMFLLKNSTFVKCKKYLNLEGFKIYSQVDNNIQKIIKGYYFIT